MPATPFNLALLAFEASLLVAGLVLLWRQLFRRSAGCADRGSSLEPWLLPRSDFLLLAFLVVVGGLSAQVATSLIVGSLHLSADARAILANAGFQIGLLLSVALLPLGLGRFTFERSELRRILRAGAATFLIALPVVSAINLAWVAFLQFCGLPTQEQDLLRLFSHAESRVWLGLLVTLAVAVAPISEELLFRATLFRYLRTRWPHWLALLVPGVVFASLHVNWQTLDGLGSLAPLVALAVILALAYERTGRITTAVVAHALFNLHSVILLLAGVTA